LYTAAELIQVLQRRLQLRAPHLRRAPGEFPPGWQHWFAAMQARMDAITGATAQALIEVFLKRPLAERPRRSSELTRWQAFNTLWRQEWHAPEPEDRKVRWLAAIVTALWHLLFLALLAWFVYLESLDFEVASKRRGEEVVQIEFIGRGTPEEIGGGQAPAEPQKERSTTEAAEASAVQAPTEIASAEVPAPQAPSIETPVPEVQQREVPEPQIPPAPPLQQNVTVSAPVPETSDFVLSPPTPRIAQPQIRVPEISSPTAPLQAVEVPEPVQPINRELPQQRIATPQLQARIPEVTQREVSAPLPPAPVRKITTPALSQPTLRTPEATVLTREIPAPASKPAAASASAATLAASQPSTNPSAQHPATAAPAATAATTPSAARPSGATPSTATAGQGPKPITAPGAFPSPAKADDWGASKRNVPGGQRGEPHGLYNAEGGPRLTEQPVNTGQPPGTLDDRIVDLDRSGTWLKRKPTDYEPTTFDKYWQPNETLLAEWVRKGIKRMAIPIPGTGKKIECVISMLALGGACGISDPNLNDQPAHARPPPDIPFKPHLQDNNGAVKPPPGG
jgi:hypothetical protein